MADQRSADTPLADAVGPHLSMLRRHARALCGSQSSGDAHVAALLEALLIDPAVMAGPGDDRVRLYRAFHGLWAATAALSEDEPAGTAAPARVAQLSSLARQALLLTAVEGFAVEEAAAILGVGGDEAARLVIDGVAELRRQSRARVLIIEDEPIIAMDIQAVVEDLGHEVMQVAVTAGEAVEAALYHRPDLVLADIQLADGSSGLDAAREILDAAPAPVVFITAYPERLLTGERPEPAFLLAKPYRVESLQAAVSQALLFRQDAAAGA